MMNEISKIDSASTPMTPPAMSQRLYAAMRSIISSMVGHELPHDRAPTQEVRSALRLRSADLAMALRPIGSAGAQQEVAAILGTMGFRNGSATDMRAVLAIYGADLAHLPRFALSAACRDFRQGRAGDGVWAPTQAQLRERAAVYLHTISKERREIEQILAAKVLEPLASPEKRARVQEMLEETMRVLAMASAREAAREVEMHAKKHPYGEAYAKSHPLHAPVNSLFGGAK